jgi:hypothetical protein
MPCSACSLFRSDESSLFAQPRGHKGYRCSEASFGQDQCDVCLREAAAISIELHYRLLVGTCLPQMALSLQEAPQNLQQYSLVSKVIIAFALAEVSNAPHVHLKCHPQGQIKAAGTETQFA